MFRPALLAAFIGLLFAFTTQAQSSLSSKKLRPLQSLENSLLFHPKSAQESWFHLPADLVEDVWLQSANGERIHSWWLATRSCTGAILFCHGNAGNLSHFSSRAAALRKALGQSVLIFDYPGYGKSTGKPSEEGCYAAADAAYEWLTKTKKIPPEKVILVGESLGGGVATELAVRKSHRGLVLVRTFTSIPAMARRSFWTFSSSSVVSNSFNNLDRMPRCQGPIFIAHGDRDTLIPLSQAKQLFEAAAEPKKFHVLKNCGHNDPWPEDFLRVLAEFLPADEEGPRQTFNFWSRLF